jgi:hypothetical protein
MLDQVQDNRTASLKSTLLSLISKSPSRIMLHMFLGSDYQGSNLDQVHK